MLCFSFERERLTDCGQLPYWSLKPKEGGKEIVLPLWGGFTTLMELCPFRRALRSGLNALRAPS